MPVMSTTTSSPNRSVCPSQVPDRTLDRLEGCSSRLYGISRTTSIGTRAWSIIPRNSRDLWWLSHLRNDVWLLWVRNRRWLLWRWWLDNRLLLIWRTIRRILGWYYPRRGCLMPHVSKTCQLGWQGPNECVRRKATEVSTRVLCALGYASRLTPLHP